jgi:microcystin-dependent protein
MGRRGASTTYNDSSYTFNIISKSSKELQVGVSSSSKSSMSLLPGILYTFIMATSSQTNAATISLNIASSIPEGAVMAFDLADCPEGWSEMDGSGSTPDARGRTIIGEGQGAGLTDRILQSTGGSETHQLTAAELPSADVTITGSVEVIVSGEDANQDEAAGNYMANGTFYHNTPDGGTSNSTTHDLAGTIDGSDQAHNIMQPYLVMKYCRKD